MDSGLASTVEAFISQSVAGSKERAYFRKPLVGFSSADDPLYGHIIKTVGPHHWRPQQFLPKVKTVISFFIPFQKELVRLNKGTGPVSDSWGLAYLAANALINSINDNLVELLIGLGADSSSVPATHTFDAQTLKAAWSHRSAAFVSGLGRFGLNRMLITRLGCAGRYGTVFTEADLPASQRSDAEYCLYYKNGGCRACLEACPAVSLRADDFDRHKCYARLLSNSEYLNLGGQVADVCGKCVVAGPCAFKEDQ